MGANQSGSSSGKSCGKLLRENLTGNCCRKFLRENLAGNLAGKSCGKFLREMEEGKKPILRKALIGGNLAFGIG